MATAAPVQEYFPFVPPAEPLPTELHNIKVNQTEVGQVRNTIRRGNKWAKVPVGHRIELTQGPEHTKIGEGMITRVSTARFSDLAAKVLQKNHSGPLTYGDCLKAMRNAYAGFREKEYVIILEYRRVN